MNFDLEAITNLGALGVITVVLFWLLKDTTRILGEINDSLVSKFVEIITTTNSKFTDIMVSVGNVNAKIDSVNAKIDGVIRVLERANERKRSD